MNTLLFKLQYYIAEENRFGFRLWPESPAAMPLAVNYLRRNGHSVTMLDHPVDEPLVVPDVDVVACYIPICDGLPHALLHLKRLKEQGKTTILMAYDDWEGMQRDIVHDYDFIDYAIRGLDREVALEHLLKKLESAEKVTAPMPGVIARIGGEVVDGGLISPKSDNLDHLLSSAEELEELGQHEYKQHCIRVSSGCPFNCTYCHIGCRRMRNRSVESVVDELKTIPDGRQIRLGTTDMLLNKEWTERFLNQLIDTGKSFKFDIDARADTVIKNQSILPLLKKAGCTDLAMGGESFHPDILKATRKGITYEQYVEAARLIVEAGMKPTFCMMLGHPLDSEETLGLTYKRIQELPEKAEILGFQYLRPLPGSKIEKECMEAGLLSHPMTYKDAMWARNAPMMPTRYLSKEELTQWMAKFNALLHTISMAKLPPRPLKQKVISRVFTTAGRGFNLSRRILHSSASVLARQTDTKEPARQIFDLSPHNTDLYRNILQRLVAAPEVTVHRPEKASSEHNPAKVNVSLRHDVDFYPDWVVRLTDIEEELGLRSVIHVILDTSFYDIEEHLPIYLELKSKGFAIGLHSTAPIHEMPLLRFAWERERFKDLFGEYPTLFTNHGICPSPVDWAERLIYFRREVEQHLEEWGIQPTTQWVEEVHSIEDSGNGGRFSFIHDDFFTIDQRTPGEKVEILTHAEHWVEHPVPWNMVDAVSYDWLNDTIAKRK